MATPQQSYSRSDDGMRRYSRINLPFSSRRVRLGILATCTLAILLVTSSGSVIFAQQPRIVPANSGGFANNFLVVPSLNFPTIQSAIDAAKSGDTVKVLPGTYTEQLFINKSMTLLGSGAASTVINEPESLITDSLGYYWGVHIANAAKVAISGFAFTTPPTLFMPCATLNACATIGVDGGASLELSSSIVHFTYLFTGLWVGVGSTPSSVPFSTGSASVTRVDFEVPSTAPTGGFPSGYGYAGVWLSGDGTLQISSSRIAVIATVGGDTFGLFLDTGTTASILYNTIVGANPIVTSPDMRADISFNAIMPTGLTPFGPNYGATEAGISIGQGSRVQVTHNTVTGSPNVFNGIYVVASSSASDPTVALIAQNTISNFICTTTVGAPAGWCGIDPLKSENQLAGIYVVPQDFTCGCGPYPQTTPNDITITQNSIYHSDVGISLQAVQNCCVVTNNAIYASTDYGLQAYEGNYTFSNNIIEGGQYGINAVGGFFSLLNLGSASAIVISDNNTIQGVKITPAYLLAVPPYTAEVIFEK